MAEIQDGSYTYGGIQTYKGHPNIQERCPDIWGHSNIQGAIQTYRRCIQTDGGIQTYRGCPNIKGASKHTGGVQTYGGIQTCRGHPNIAAGWKVLLAVLHIWRQPNIQGGIQTYSRASKYMGGVQTYSRASKHMGGVPNMGGIQTYRGIQIYGWCPNIWGHPNIQVVHPNIWWIFKHTGCIHTYGGIQMYGAYGHPLSVTKHAFYVLCMYRGHPNITQTYSRVFKHVGASKHMEGVQTWVASKHTGGIQMYGGIWTLP